MGASASKVNFGLIVLGAGLLLAAIVILTPIVIYRAHYANIFKKFLNGREVQDVHDLHQAIADASLGQQPYFPTLIEESRHEFGDRDGQVKSLKDLVSALSTPGDPTAYPS